MTLYALYRSVNDPAGLPRAVAEKFSWFAAILPPVHALVHGLWGQLVALVVGIIVVIALGRAMGGGAGFWLYCLLALSAGLAAPGAERRALKRRGYGFCGYRLAPDADLARLALLETCP